MRETAEKLSADIPNAFRGDAYALLVAVYKDPTHSMELRVDCAKQAVRYERPALSASTLKIEDPLERFSDAQLAQLIGIADSLAQAVQAE